MPHRARWSGRGVPDGVRRASRNQQHVAGLESLGAATHADVQRAFEQLELVLLVGMCVFLGARLAQWVVDRVLEDATTRLSRRPADDEPAPRVRVEQDVARSNHDY
jgi:hypothetical protein